MPRNTLRTLARLFLGGLTAAAAVLPCSSASASYLVIPPPAVAEASAAYKYANMTGAEALAELDKRKVPYKAADPIAGVVTPVRLTGKLHGVWIHSSIPEGQRATSMYEVLDARLALALDDFAKILERHDIEEVVHYSLYRPNVPREDHDEAAHEAARANEKAEKQAAAALHASDKAAVASAKPAVATAHHGAAATPAVSAQTAVKPGHKPAVATVAKVTPAAKPHAKSSLPAASTKALPQPPSKGAAAPHGQKRKDPVHVEKPALPALPAGGKGTSTAPVPPSHAATAASGKGTSTAAVPSGHAAPERGASHPKMTANNAGSAPRARAATTPAKGAVPGKGAAGSKGAVPASAAVAKAPSARTTPAAKAPSAGVKSNGVVVGPKSNGVVVASKNTPAVVANTPAAAAKTTASAPVSRQTWAPPGTRHPAGLAIDVALLKKRDGQWISVARDFSGKIGAKTCGDGVRTADTPEGRELRSLVCEANDLGVFTYVLTPNFNAAHYDHFHMEIRPTVKWFMYQ